MAALSKPEIQKRLKEMRDWSHAGKAIHKKFTFQAFMPAIRFVNGIAEVAEKIGHHPDITIRYNVVEISLWTHSEGGVTDKDLELAKTIDQVAATIT